MQLFPATHTPTDGESRLTTGWNYTECHQHHLRESAVADATSDTADISRWSNILNSSAIFVLGNKMVNFLSTRLILKLCRRKHNIRAIKVNVYLLICEQYQYQSVLWSDLNLLHLIRRVEILLRGLSALSCEQGKSWIRELVKLVNRTIGCSFSHPVNKPTNQSINQSPSQSINPLINQSVN